MHEARSRSRYYSPKKKPTGTRNHAPRTGHLARATTSHHLVGAAVGGCRAVWQRRQLRPTLTSWDTDGRIAAAWQQQVHERSSRRFVSAMVIGSSTARQLDSSTQLDMAVVVGVAAPSPALLLRSSHPTAGISSYRLPMSHDCTDATASV